MIRSLRTPFFVLALVALLIAFLVEIGSSLIFGGNAVSSSELRSVPSSTFGDDGADPDFRDAMKSVTPKNSPPGFGIPYLALLDGLLLFTVGLMGMSLILPERIQGRIQGVITFIVTLLDAIASIIAIFVTLGLLLTMVGLFLAAPFGTLAYLAVWGFFDRGGAARLLGILLLLKLVFAVLLVVAHQRFLQNKGLVLLVVTSLVANLVISFLHAFVPGILVSITDALAAIIVAVIALIWAVVLLIGSIISIVKALKLEKSSA